MIDNFFQLSGLPADQLFGSYDARLVILSYLVATFASYIALDITGRLRDIGNTAKGTALWLLGGAFAMGAGIWSMHFIGMLAFSIPNMAMNYDLFLTGISMLVAIFASGFALYLLKDRVIKVNRLAIGGIILGLAIASMHYVGMEAMKIEMNIRYLPSLFFLSIVIAIIASEAALWLALKSNQVVLRMRVRLKIVSALIMGAAICGMHYTGMAAAVFTMNADQVHQVQTSNQDILAISIATVTFIILTIAFLASMYKDALNQQAILKAKQAGMSEVAASVLHNIGNVLNSIVVSAETLENRITKSNLDTLSNLNDLFKKNQDNIGEFITKNEQGKQIPEYIQEISIYWQNEKKLLLSETRSLLNYISHVKNIVSFQQELSKPVDFEQLISVSDLLDEALTISGLKENQFITLQQNYASLNNYYVDKVKLLQILINVLRNAKDSVTASTNMSKTIIISTGVTENKKFTFIEITDNGVGIPPENINRIFGYGYTTKVDGHGFGLHSSAIAANEMGGTMTVASPGPNKGATFTLELPYNTDETAIKA